MAAQKAKLLRYGSKLCIGGTALLILAWRKWKYQRRFLDANPISIASAPQGAVQVQGKAASERPVRNLESENVAFLYWCLEKKRNPLQIWGKWKVQQEGCLGASLILQDASGALRLDMADAQMNIREKTFAWRGLSDLQKQQAAQWLGQEKAAALGNSFLYRLVTYEIPLSAPLIVCGYLETQSYKEIMRVANSGDYEPPRGRSHGILRNDANCPLHVATDDKDRFVRALGKWIKFQIFLGAAMLAGGVLCLALGFFDID